MPEQSRVAFSIRREAVLMQRVDQSQIWLTTIGNGNRARHREMTHRQSGNSWKTARDRQDKARQQILSREEEFSFGLLSMLQSSFSQNGIPFLIRERGPMNPSQSYTIHWRLPLKHNIRKEILNNYRMTKTGLTLRETKDLSAFSENDWSWKGRQGTRYGRCKATSPENGSP